MTTRRQTFRRLMRAASAATVPLILLLLSANPAVAAVVFSAVAAGDMTENSAILWTRTADGPTQSAQPVAIELTAQVSTDPDFAGSVLNFRGMTDGRHDGTVKFEVTGLQSHQRYYYRFVAAGGEVSPVGRFTTAAAPGQEVEIKFAFSGDADGRFRPYPVTHDFAKLDLDYFIFLGDTIYETASKGSPATEDVFANRDRALADYRRKNLENILPVATGGFAGLKALYAAQGNYTLFDNHELGNRQFQSGGASAGEPPGKGVDARDAANDVNRSGSFMNASAGFEVLLQAYKEFEPIREQRVQAPGDARIDGTQKLYFAQRWGRNSIFINVDDRSYRDIRLIKADGTDDTGLRADNPGRTMLGRTQLRWLEDTLLNAEQLKIVWKFVAISSPIDQLGADSGKSWFGGYRAERNQLLKFIAEQQIGHVVFLSTDDHLNRVNELSYAPDPAHPDRLERVAGAFTIVAGPLGAGGPDTVTMHDFISLKAKAEVLTSGQAKMHIDPVGLDPTFPGLTSVFREGDPDADRLRQPIDFYSPDSFNYVVLDISKNGKTLSVDTWGIDSYQANMFPEPGLSGAPRRILGFKIVDMP